MHDASGPSTHGAPIDNQNGIRNASGSARAPRDRVHMNEKRNAGNGSVIEPFPSLRVVRLDQIRSVDTPKHIQFVVRRLPAAVMQEVGSALKLELTLD